MNAGRDRPSLNGLEMRVPLSFLNYESDRGKNNQDMNAGRDRPSLNGLEMRVPLSFLNYESDRGNALRKTKWANGKKTNTDTGKSIGIRTQKQPRHESGPKNNQDTNAGRDRPSLNGLKMRVPLSFLNYESDRGNALRKTKWANGKKTNTDTGKSIGIRTQKQPRHESGPKNNQDTNAGRDRPSLDGLKMRVPLSFLNYESDRGNQENLTNVPTWTYLI